jgi:hypothetical protein
MRWVTVFCSMTAAVCRHLARIHFLVWLRSLSAWANSLFAASAVAARLVVMMELAQMYSQTPAGYSEILRRMPVAFLAIVVTLVWSTRFYLRAGRIGLAWLVRGLRALTMVSNF